MRHYVDASNTEYPKTRMRAPPAPLFSGQSKLFRDLRTIYKSGGEKFLLVCQIYTAQGLSLDQLEHIRAPVSITVS